MLLSKESKEDDPKKQQWAHEGSYNQLYPEKIKNDKSQEIMNRVFNKYGNINQCCPNQS